MTRRLFVIPLLVTMLLAIALLAIRGRYNVAVEATHQVKRSPFSIWSQIEGTIQSPREQPLASDLSTRATLTHLAPEGSMVAAGQVVARFDTGELEQRLADAEKNFVLNEAQLRSLEEATLPMEMDDLAAQQDESSQALATEAHTLVEIERLRGRQLVSEQELAAQRSKTEGLRKSAQRLEKRIELTSRVLHPARLAAARASLDAADVQARQLRQQKAHADLIAENAGMVIYVPLHQDGEFRTVREGDALYRNQKFAMVADMSNLVVLCNAPESQVSLLSEGRRAVVTPLAFPQLRLEGRVETVGQMALSQAGRPAWQRFFAVRIRLIETGAVLRSGMSVYAQVLSYNRDDALVVPRAFVAWEGEQPFCLVRKAGGTSRVNIRIAAASDEAFEVAEGLNEGDVVVRRDRL